MSDPHPWKNVMIKLNDLVSTIKYLQVFITAFCELPCALYDRNLKVKQIFAQSEWCCGFVKIVNNQNTDPSEKYNSTRQ